MTVIPSGPVFAIQEIPFSFHGSWLNVSPVIAQHVQAEDLHLVSHQNGMHPVLRFVPLVPDTGDRAPAGWRAASGGLTWQDPHGDITLVYESADTLRVSGEGLDLEITPSDARLTPFSGMYLYRDPVDGSFQFTSYETGRRYRITALEGATARLAGGEGLAGASRRLTLTGAGRWEAAIEEIDSARTPYTPADDFAGTAARAEDAFGAFAAEVTGPPEGRPAAAELAAYVLWSATVRPAGFVGRPAVLMSKHWMDKVWSWDHCFNALALAPGAPRLAWHQFHLPFDHQDESGALPDSVTHSEVLYNFVKPPIHGWALRRLRERLPGPVEAGELEETYRRLGRWTDFWLTARRAPGEALPHYQHGNDSGWDNATTFDPRRVLVTADLASFLILQLHELARMADELGHTEDAARHTDTAKAMMEALLDQLWVDGRFHARSPHTGRLSHSRSLLDLMPVVLGELLPKDVSDRLAESLAAHLTSHGLATEHPQSPHYEADGYWRGPIWAPSTVLIEDGLRRAGHTRLADEINARFRALCEESGFAENFDALTGQGLRDRAYTWTASCYLLLAGDHQRRSGTAQAPTPPGDSRPGAASDS
ncbi:Glycogen debranching enzyme (alpha-1,6-glucosidase) [Streptomyces sp. DvalAA-14]|uniref:amylo-alpha-1,6-glucosidase n=1 Tax=unclassified Streptomyces TaxID=2593676 RepID=UPI00081B69A6|nr:MULTISPECIES: trehalase family glycosidase [unclassified Streptomyces]MYS20372.1 glycogen debranching protein [Streptomyces sp. SID4948]SCD67491.1 Glycogen debranching enzyme (alpha-1,6-glucosidase) [Streptomyces sp. DvalAA-14]